MPWYVDCFIHNDIRFIGTDLSQIIFRAVKKYFKNCLTNMCHQKCSGRWQNMEVSGFKNSNMSFLTRDFKSKKSFKQEVLLTVNFTDRSKQNLRLWGSSAPPFRKEGRRRLWSWRIWGASRTVHFYICTKGILYLMTLTIHSDKFYCALYSDNSF